MSEEFESEVYFGIMNCVCLLRRCLSECQFPYFNSFSSRFTIDSSTVTDVKENVSSLMLKRALHEICSEIISKLINVNCLPDLFK